MNVYTNIVIAGRITAVQGASADSSGVIWGKSTEVKYKISYQGLTGNESPTDWLTPTNRTTQALDIVAAQVGDPCVVFLFAGTAEMAVLENLYAGECQPSN